jgi:tetratricopeptide (TPR) repeat protein
VVLPKPDVQKAVRLLSEVVAAAPTFARGWTERGIAASMLGDFKQAEESLVQSSIQKDDPEPSTAIGIFYMYERQGRRADALKSLEAAASTYPGSLLALGYLGDAYFRDRRYQEALDTFATYAVRAPASPWAAMRRGAALSALGQHDRAISEAEVVAARQPKSVAAQIALASRQIDAARFDAARATIERGLALAPEHPALITRLSYIDLAQGRPAEALKLANRAIAAVGDGRGETLAGYAHIDAAHALGLLGRNAEAFAALKKAVDLGVDAEETERLVRDPRLKALIADPRCPAAIKQAAAL